MNTYVPIETPGGTIWTEIEQRPGTEGIVLTDAKDTALRSFNDAVEALRENARFLMKSLEELAPNEIEVAFGVKAGVEGGNVFFGLAKASGEANYSVTVKWKSNDENTKKSG